VWLNELPFSWRLEDCPPSSDTNSDRNSEDRQEDIHRSVVEASIFWRGKRAFSGWTVFLLISDERDLVSYQTIYKAGGAKVHDKLDAFLASAPHDFKLALTDCISEGNVKRSLEVALKKLKSANVQLLRCEFTMEWLESKGEVSREAFALT